MWQVLPSVGDKNALAMICTFSEYYPSSFHLHRQNQFKVFPLGYTFRTTKVPISITITPTTRSSVSPCAPTTTSGLSVLAECTTDVRQRYLQNGLQLNPDKSEALIVGTNNQLHAVTSSVSSVSVAGVDLPVAEEGARSRAWSTSGSGTIM